MVLTAKPRAMQLLRTVAILLLLAGAATVDGAAANVTGDSDEWNASGLQNATSDKPWSGTGGDPVAPRLRSRRPSAAPSDVPSLLPSATPSDAPSLVPSRSPSHVPAPKPTSGNRTRSSKPDNGGGDVVAAPDQDKKLESDAPSLVPSVVPSFAPSNDPSVAPSGRSSRAPSDTPSKAPSMADTFSPSDVPTAWLQLEESATSDHPSGAPSAAPSLEAASPENATLAADRSAAPSESPSQQASDAPSRTPTRVAAEPSAAPSKEPSVAPSLPASVWNESWWNTTSTANATSASDSPSSVQSRAPSRAPSPGPTVAASLAPTDRRSAAPSSSSSVGPSEAPSRGGTGGPTAVFSQMGFPDETGAPTAGPTATFSQMGFPDDTEAPTAGPTAEFSQMGHPDITDTPTTSPTAEFSQIGPPDNTDGPTAGPTATFSQMGYPETDQPTAGSAVQSRQPSRPATGRPTVSPVVITSSPTRPETTKPTLSPTADLLASAVTLESSSVDVMDNATVVIFERVVGQKYLPQVLPWLHAAQYTNTSVRILNQTLLSDSDDIRRLANQSDMPQVTKLYVKTDNVAILLRISSHVDPPAENFDDLIAQAMEEYPNILQKKLSESTVYFQPVSSNNNTESAGPVAPSKEADPSSPIYSLPILIIICAAVGAVLVLLLLVFLLDRRRAAYTAPRLDQERDDGSLDLSDSKGDMYSYGRIDDPSRGVLMIQTSFSTISDSNIASPAPFCTADNDALPQYGVLPSCGPMGQSYDEEVSDQRLAIPTSSPSTRHVSNIGNVIEKYGDKNVGEPRNSSKNDANSTSVLATLSDDMRSQSIHYKISEESFGDESHTLKGLTFVGSAAIEDTSLASLPRSPQSNVPTSGEEKPRSLLNFWTKKEEISVKEPEKALGEPVDSLFSFETHDADEPRGQAEWPQKTSETQQVPPYVKHGHHTGRVLHDLGDMEREWKGQLESTTTTMSTTPRRENRERFKKPPRQLLFDRRILKDGKSI